MHLAKKYLLSRLLCSIAATALIAASFMNIGSSGTPDQLAKAYEILLESKIQALAENKNVVGKVTGTIQDLSKIAELDPTGVSSQVASAVNIVTGTVTKVTDAIVLSNARNQVMAEEATKPNYLLHYQIGYLGVAAVAVLLVVSHLYGFFSDVRQDLNMTVKNKPAGKKVAVIIDILLLGSLAAGSGLLLSGSLNLFYDSTAITAAGLGIGVACLQMQFLFFSFKYMDFRFIHRIADFMDSIRQFIGI